MRFKHLPDPPADLDAVADARRAIPLVPSPEDEGVARLERRLDLPSRDVARRWLTLLRALGLVERTPSGFRRGAAEATPAHLREAVRERVFHADRALSVLADADGPRDADAVFAAVRGSVPTWERHKHPRTWETVWRDRTARLLAWLELVGLVEERPQGYVAVGEDGDA